jgi:hypothetical protein
MKCLFLIYLCYQRKIQVFNLRIHNIFIMLKGIYHNVTHHRLQCNTSSFAMSSVIDGDVKMPLLQCDVSSFAKQRSKNDNESHVGHDLFPCGSQTSPTWGMIFSHVGLNLLPRGARSFPMWVSIFPHVGLNRF